MTFEQSALFTILAAVFLLLVWGRWRYDLVAFAALLAGVLAGVVPADRAFSGFGHPAVVLVALVLVVSRGLVLSGVVDLLARHTLDPERPLGRHIAVMAGLAAGLSAVVNNVAALALLMPLDLQAAKRAGRAPGSTLMPLAFASILGGMITMIGTPPNIVVATYRGQALGEPYGMFDFTPVGLACALVGVLFVALVGWRLIPRREGEGAPAGPLASLVDYVAEVRLREGSPLVGESVAKLTEAERGGEVGVLGALRHGRRLPVGAPLAEGDVLVVRTGAERLEDLAGEWGLEYLGTGKDEKLAEVPDLTFAEVVVPEGALAAGRSARSLGLLRRHGVALVGIARQGRRIASRVDSVTIRAGDVLLLMGPSEGLPEVIARLGCLPLAERGLEPVRRDRAGLAAGGFLVAILLASLGMVELPIALGLVALGLVLGGIVPVRQLYESIEWPVIVLLGSMIPLGEALEGTGGTALVAGAVLAATGDLGPVWVLVLLLIVTMTLSDVMNNTATAVIAAPVAVDVAGRLGVSPDPFLMAVAVAASCAFLTPIGHKNNTLILGPGGYRFGDYWRMGLPLEVLIVTVAVPTILLVWPL